MSFCGVSQCDWRWTLLVAVDSVRRKYFYCTAWRADTEKPLWGVSTLKRTKVNNNLDTVWQSVLKQNHRTVEFERTLVAILFSPIVHPGEVPLSGITTCWCYQPCVISSLAKGPFFPIIHVAYDHIEQCGTWYQPRGTDLVPTHSVPLITTLNFLAVW